MHDLSDLGPIPAFLAKLWKLVDAEETDDIIGWTDSEQSFVITNPVRFTQELLPKYYKHNNMASFIRQLNMYGFHKVVSIESGGLKSDKDYMEFAHTCFVKDHPYLMENIKRKMATTRAQPLLGYVKSMGKDDKGAALTQVLEQVLTDVNSLKSKQAGWDAKLAAMKRENEALWRELAIFRQKHHKQEQIINKLIQFIVTMVRPSARSGQLRRRYPLMLSDAERATKVVSTSAGPTIRELDPMELLLGDSDLEADGADRDVPIPEAQCHVQQMDGQRLAGGSSPYAVLSPEEAEPALAKSPWLHDSSDTECGLAMTPINPMDIINPAASPNEKAIRNPQPAEKSQPSILAGASKPTISRHLSKPSPLKMITTDKKSTIGNLGANNRKKLLSKKKRRKTSTTHKKEKDLLEEALNLIGGADLNDSNSEPSVAPSSEASSTGNEGNDKILKILENAVLNSQPTTSAALPAESVEQVDNVLHLPSPQGAGAAELDALDPESLALVRPNTSYYADDVARYVHQTDLGNHVDLVQGDIDILKEFLKNDGYSLDANSLLELFNDDPMQLIMPPASENKSTKEGGSELMTYSSPNLMDLMDMYGSTPAPYVPSSAPPSPSPSGLETPIATPASPGFPPPSKKRRK